MTITSSANRDSFHALKSNSNLNANPTYNCVFAEKSHTFESWLVLFIGSFNHFILFVFYISLLIGLFLLFHLLYFVCLCRIILFILIGLIVKFISY